MKAEQLSAQSWEDIVFEYRNKEYGAYFNRKSYSKHVLLGLLITVITGSLLLATPSIIDWIKGHTKEEPGPAKTIKYTDLAPPPSIENKPPPPKLEIPPPVKTIIKYTPGARGEAGLASWCNGTPAITIGWRGEVRRCT